MPDLRLKLQDMTDKLKSKISSRFLPKSTYSAPAATGVTKGSGSNSQASTSTPRGSNSGPSTLRGQPIIIHNSSRRNDQTLENENARDELLKHGITVRDFQVEADARKYGETASPEMIAR